MITDEHDGHSWDFSQSPLQILITRCNDKCSPLLYSVNNAIISICSLVVADQSFKPNQYTGGLSWALEQAWTDGPTSPVLQWRSRWSTVRLIIKHFPSKQSIEFLNMSSLLEIDMFMKFVSRMIRYGGPMAVLKFRNKWVGSCTTSRCFICMMLFLSSIFFFSATAASSLAFFLMSSQSNILQINHSLNRVLSSHSLLAHL